MVEQTLDGDELLVGSSRERVGFEPTVREDVTRAMLERAARQLGTEVQRRAMALATILEPLLIVAMGLVVMLIVLAVLLPIIQLNQFAR